MLECTPARSGHDQDTIGGFDGDRSHGMACDTGNSCGEPERVSKGQHHSRHRNDQRCRPACVSLVCHPLRRLAVLIWPTLAADGVSTTDAGLPRRVWLALSRFFRPGTAPIFMEYAVRRHAAADRIKD